MVAADPLPAPASAHPRDVSTAWILRPAGRPLFVFAHQADETVLGGMIARIVEDDARGRFVWWTNGDGLAPGEDADPVTYGEMRIREATEALARLGASAARKVDLETSEIENYRRLTHVAKGGALRESALDYFEAEAERVVLEVQEADPDRVFLLAWQGGHPEHDLVHAMTLRGVRALRRETGRPIPVIQCPAYEYTIACALRFKPWFTGDRRHVVLDAHEREKKALVFDAYPSQQKLFGYFRRVVLVFTLLSRLRGRALTAEDYVGREEFGVVDPDLDYGKSTHRLERLNYMFDDFEGIPIRFDTMVRPVIQAILRRGT